LLARTVILTYAKGSLIDNRFCKRLSGVLSQASSYLKGNNVVTLTSVNSLQNAIAQAERQVQRDLSQVQQDSSQLAQSQAQLATDQRQLSSVQQQAQREQRVTPATSSRASPAPAAASSAPNLERAIQAKVKPPAQPPVTATTVSLPTPAAAILVPPAAPTPKVNTEGQTIGRVIDVTA
jgi:TolA-binding protein